MKASAAADAEQRDALAAHQLDLMQLQQAEGQANMLLKYHLNMIAGLTEPPRDCWGHYME